MKNNNKGFVWLPVLLGVAILGIVGSLFWQKTLDKKIEEINLGTAPSTQFVGNLLPIGTSTLNYEIGTTSSAGDRRFFRSQIDYATSSAVDIYDSLIIGRVASTTIDEAGNVTVQDLVISGTCTGCAGASTADLQDAYNNSAVDATILTADTKDIVFLIGDNTDPGNVIISAVSQGGLQLGVGSTTNGVWHGYGGLGIGTTSPGAGLAVNATSTILSGPAYILDHLRTSFLIATSTANNTFGGALDVTEAATSTFTGGLSVGTGGLLSSTGITLSGGDLLLASGKITQASGATSTIPSLSVSTNLTAVNLLVTGDLNVDTGTSTFAAGLNIVAQGLGITAGGLNITAGDLLTAGVIKISSTGTSTSDGTLALNHTTGTSTIAGNLDITNSLRIGTAVYTNIASTTNVGTTTIAFDCSLGPKATAVIDRDAGVIMKNCFGGQSLIMIIDNPPHEAGADHQIDWDGIADANGEFGSTTLKFEHGTSTIGYVVQGATNVFTVLFATSSDNITTFGILDVGRGYTYQD